MSSVDPDLFFDFVAFVGGTTGSVMVSHKICSWVVLPGETLQRTVLSCGILGVSLIDVSACCLSFTSSFCCTLSRATSAF